MLTKRIFNNKRKGDRTVKTDNHFQFVSSKHLNGVTLLNASMSDFSYDKHAHEEYSIGVTLRGSQDFFCRNAFHKSRAGGLILFNPEDVHDGHSGDKLDLEYFMLYLHPNELNPLFQSMGIEHNHTVRVEGTLLDDTILRHQILFMSQMIQNQTTTKIEQESGLFQIAHSLVRNAGKLKQHQSVKRKETLLIRAKEYIHSHLEQDISIDDISQAANLSKFHFIRLFRTQFGITPHQYVLNCRLNLARKALEAGSRSSDVAHNSGFSDSSHLNRRFKRVFGMTPKQYQLQFLN